jgi:4-alpha-glucanotransferase
MTDPAAKSDGPPDGAAGGAADPALDRLAELAGILPSYRDLDKREHVASPETKRALLDAMGLDGDPVPHLARLEPALGGLPPALACVADAQRTAEPGLSFDAWRLETEGGDALEGRGTLPALPPGLHRLYVGEESALLIAAPARAPTPADVARSGGRAGSGAADRDAARVWGFTGSLYGLHARERATQLGDYDALGAAAEALAAHGADFLGVNPVHALGIASGQFSPYSPSHRGFLNTAHIAVGDGVREAEALPELIDYGEVDRREARLRARFRNFRDDTGEFAAFRQRRGKALEDFALFEALSERHGHEDWRAWPAGFESPDAAEAQRFAAERPGETAFHAWLQWLADAQLGMAQARARAAGMALGLYTDMAVGVRPGGAEVWARPDVFARGVSLGAPPDHFNPHGQTWGLAPLSPLGLARADYRPFVETIRGVLRHAGLARIDHVLGLARCFWVPEGEGAPPGGYVRYPLDLMLALVRLEAWRLGCVVVGEDLGNVPEGLRDRLHEARLYGCTVAQFERDAEERLETPERHRPLSLASFGTHDTPTLKGWWEMHDIDWRVTLGQFDEAQAAEERRQRERDRGRLMELLSAAGIWDDGGRAPREMTPELAAAVHGLLARSNADLLAVQLDDALCVLEQPNFPGTIDEHPNWRRRLPVPVEDLADDPRIARTAEAVRQRRARPAAESAAESAAGSAARERS